MDYPQLQVTKITRCTTARTAGTADSTGSMIDMAGFDSALFFTTLGVVTAGSDISLTIKGGNSTTSTAATALTPSAAVTNSTAQTRGQGLIFALEFVNIGFRYLWPRVTIGGANCACGDVYCFQAPGKSLPVSQSTSSIYASTWAFGAST